jgi:hypothetical protein
MYLCLVHNHGGRLYGHTNKGQVLCMLLWLPNRLSPSVLIPSLMFLGSVPNSWKSMSSAFHWLASEGCVRILHLCGSSSVFFLSTCHRMSFASLGSTKYRCRRGVIGKYHTTFRGTFLFPILYHPWLHTRHVVLSAYSS